VLVGKISIIPPTNAIIYSFSGHIRLDGQKPCKICFVFAAKPQNLRPPFFAASQQLFLFENKKPHDCRAFSVSVDNFYQLHI
jgi:hypothetical protein